MTTHVFLNVNMNISLARRQGSGYGLVSETLTLKNIFSWVFALLGKINKLVLVLPKMPNCEFYKSQVQRLVRSCPKWSAKMSSTFQTSSIDSYRRFVLKLWPKNVAYSFHGMLCKYVCGCLCVFKSKQFKCTVKIVVFVFLFRLLLAAMHYSENAHRPPAHDQMGNISVQVK